MKKLVNAITAAICWANLIGLSVGFAFFLYDLFKASFWALGAWNQEQSKKKSAKRTPVSK